MIIKVKENNYAHLTVKERIYPSYPTKQLHYKKLLKGRILDFGCGLGKDIDFLQKNNYQITPYDPYYFTNYPQGKFDTIICNYVLNVLFPEEQSGVLMEISELLHPDGKAYFAVRRDIKKNGFRLHYKHQKQVYQCNVVLPYKSILKKEHCEIYEYQHYNKMLTNKDSACPFCNLETDRILLTEIATAYAIADKYPVSKGHTLIIPKRHVANYFDLTFKEQQACWLVLNRVKQLLAKKYQPDGFNVGININKAGGQTVPHAHIHVIPRYEGDVENAVGGIRNLVGVGDYLKSEH